ncbi:hypothetical protein [Geoglobus acetivorans]|uniref:Rubrerythrin diiron-binding domain-containing protein n=1 Tax=Geoglobus acetivorans TaxID=565033 RepID=A0ABZ3H692_GEOAI|nr:hypothetical protein [Geoglobus acetivorans]
MTQLVINMNSKILARLLARAYVAEHTECEAISETMLQLGDENISKPFFNLIKDNEIHKMMIENVIERLSFSIEDFKEYSIRTIGVKKFDFTEDFTTQQLNEILKWERWARNYYRNLLDQDFSQISQELGEETVEFVKDTLRKLIQWEEMHIKLIEDLMSKA